MLIQAAKHVVELWLSRGLHAILNAVSSKWAVITGFVAFGASLTKVGPWLWAKYEAVRDYRLLIRRLGAELYTRDDLFRATEFYVEPECQLTDPAGQEDFRHLASMRAGAHKTLLNLLAPTSKERFMMLLADSGMGKTTVLMNFYVRYGRGHGGGQKIVIVPLGHPSADDLISKVRDKSNTVLFLDAFDEDTKAIADYRSRLDALVQSSREFSKVLMTCRTQFFETDAEIPQEIGLMKLATVGAGESRVHSFSKLYLSPFSDAQVEKYVRKRFPLWRHKERQKTREIVAAAPEITLRPMLLSHIPDLIARRVNVSLVTDLYAAMVDAWLMRERPFVQPEHLRKFSTALAVDLYTKREERGAEAISPSEASEIVGSLAVPLESWQFRGRSLLNRNADGTLKFSHRSLMEYFFVVAFFEDPAAMKRVAWTDQMKRFWWEMVSKRHGNRYKDDRYSELAVDLRNGRLYGDSSDLYRLSLRKIVVSYGYGSLMDYTKKPVHHSPVPFIGPLLFERLPIHASWRASVPKWGLSEYGVVDLALGLLWNDTLNLVDISALDQFRIDSSGWKWRLPTVYEAASLRRLGDSGDEHPKELFQQWPDAIWVDVPEENRYRLLDYRHSLGATGPFFYPSHSDIKGGVRLVKYLI